MPQVISSVKALLKHNGKFLFLKQTLHKGSIWDLPGGKIEYGEEPAEALVREVKEEVDVDVRVRKSVGLWWFFSKNNKHQVICHTFLCDPIGEIHINTTKNPTNEVIDEYCWLTSAEILDAKTIEIADSLRNLLQEVR